MPDYTTETRTFVGRDGYAGFLKGRRYPLRYQVLPGEQIRLELDHIPVEMEPLVVRAARFEEWWVVAGKSNQVEQQEPDQPQVEEEDAMVEEE